MGTERKKYIDYARGVGIILIILGHFAIPVLTQIIYTFHVPLFAIITGLLYKQYSGVVSKYFKRLMKPYICACFIIVYIAICKEILKLFVKGYGAPYDAAKKWLFASLYASGSNTDFLGFHIEYIGAIWYFWALFWVILFLYILEKINVKEAIRFILVLMIFIASLLSANCIWLPLSIQSGGTLLIFTYLAYTAKKYNTYNFIISHRLKYFIYTIFILLWGYAIYLALKEEPMSISRAFIPSPLINVGGYSWKLHYFASL